MVTHFITLEIALPASPADLPRSIATELQRKGKPLRWAITAINRDRQTAQIEAVVTVESAFSISSHAVTTV